MASRHLLRSLRQITIVLVALVTVVFSPVAYADLTNDDLRSLDQQTTFYDDSCNNGTGVALVGSDNPSKIWNFFISKGLKAEQVAGIMGNFRQESNFNPAIQEKGRTDPNPADGIGFGLAQWTFTGRQQPLVNLAQSRNLPATDLGVQLDYVWQELTGSFGHALRNLKAANTVQDATFVFHRDYEISADTIEKIQNRVKFGQENFDKYNAGSATGATRSTICNANGTASRFIDGFTFFEQCDKQWKDQIYGDGMDICSAGCGPTSMAMIITNLTGQTVTPGVVTAYAASQGMWISGSGSSWRIPDVTAKKWGLKSTAIGSNVAKINEVLNNGGLVIMAGGGAAPFTGVGHYIVVRAVKDGKWKLADPYPYRPGGMDTNKVEWTPSDVLSRASAGSIYAITK